MTTYHIEYKNRDLDVEVDIGPTEPDVGVFGNGKVALSIEAIRDDEGDSVIGGYTALELDDIAQEIYAQLGEG